MPKRDFNEVVLQRIATLMKSYFGMGVLLQICYIFSEHLFLRTPLEDCFCFRSFCIIASFEKTFFLNVLSDPIIRLSIVLF